MSNSKKTLIHSLVTGEIISLDELKVDFFYKQFGSKGLAIIPSDVIIYAPSSGKITNIFETHHSFQITTKNNVLINIYLGIRSEKLYGEGITTILVKNQRVSAGDPVAIIDLELMKKRGINPVIIMGLSSKDNDFEITFKKGSTIGGNLLGNIMVNK